jgi:c-di-GMP-binding flagellar brake protein YcgR
MEDKKMPHGEIFMDRRKHKRMNKMMNVTYKVMPREEAADDILLISKKIAQTLDISISGMQLISDEALKGESIIRLDVQLEGEQTPLATFAEVRWCRPDDKLKKYRSGLEFLVIKEDHITAIRKITGE